MTPGGRAVKNRAALAAFLVTAIAVWAALPSRPADAQQLSGSGDRSETAAQQEIATLAAAPSAIEADALDERVRALVVAGRAAEPEVREFAERAVALRRGAADPPALLASSLSLLGEVLLAAGELDPAANAMVEAEELLLPLADGERQLGRVRCRLAVVRRAEGNPPEAALLAASGLELLERDAAPGDPDRAQCAAELAEIANAMGDYRTAWRTYEKLLEDQESVHGTDSPEAGIARCRVAQAASDAGDYSTAANVYRQALSTLAASLGPSDLEVAIALGGLANVARRQGDFVEARRLLEQALAILENTLEPDDPRVATMLNSLGNVQSALGDFPAARLTYERTLAIWESISGPEDPTVARALSNLGAVVLNQGDPEGAVPLLERSVAIRERAYGADAPILGVPLINLGDAFLQAGDLDRARACLERAAAIFEQDRGDRTYATEAVNNLGLLLLDQGHGDEAAAAFDRARRIVEETAGHSHPRTAIVIANQARAAAFGGRLDAALGYALESERIAREHLRLTAAGLSEREALIYAHQQRESLDLALSLLAEPGVDDPILVAAAWDALIRSRALVLEEMTLRRALLVGTPAASAALEAWGAAADRLSQLLVGGGAVNSADDVNEARRDLERAERELGAASPPFERELARAGYGFEEVAAAVPPNACLVAYTRFFRTYASDPVRRLEAPEQWYLAFVLSPAGVVEARPLAPAATIDPLVERWRGAARRSTGGESEAKTVGELLRNRVWDPMAERCDDAQRVFLVPDGELGLVNFAALPGGLDTFLVERASVMAVLSHERDLVSRPLETEAGNCLLALGSPDFDAAPDGSTDSGLASIGPSNAANDSPSRGLTGVRFPPLPKTADEVEAAAALWTASDVRATVVRLSGAEASEAAFKALAPGFRVLHLATHGFFLDDTGPVPGGGERGVGGLVAADTVSDEDIDGNPVRLSGLVLAGANRRQSGDEDGILTAEEIATLNLDGVEWAVLSACDSGVGEVGSHEGVFGLRRAFRIAGVRTVIMSLWAVDDEAAREWMTALYRARLSDGLSTAESVRRANLDVLTARRLRGESVHPFFWAPFLASGDWR